MNVSETTRRKRYYRPLPCCEDLMFNDECDENGLCHWKFKVHWPVRLQFSWKDETTLKYPVTAEDKEVQEEPQKILDFVSNIGNKEIIVVEPFFRTFIER